MTKRSQRKSSEPQRAQRAGRDSIAMLCDLCLFVAESSPESDVSIREQVLCRTGCPDSPLIVSGNFGEFPVRLGGLKLLRKMLWLQSKYPTSDSRLKHGTHGTTSLDG